MSDELRAEGMTPEDEERRRVEGNARLERESDLNTEREMARRSRRSFLVGGVATLGGVGAWEWIRTRRKDEGTPWPLRRVLDTNAEIARDYFGNARLAKEYPLSEAVTTLKINERIGMEDVLVPAEWSLKVDGADIETDEDDNSTTLNMDEIRKFPHAEHVTLLKCIEGWSQKVHWGGARFADFAKEYPPPDGAQYVGMETPDAGYFVSLDLASAMQPQTLLCYEMNGEALPEPHGAPLRLVIPTKYGIKNLKRIGRIFYSEERPRDYWAEFGYDWYAGL
jgi:DMSO/TMAO reductase YedYZ molybdopterin-dependent catalytic subunit